MNTPVHIIEKLVVDIDAKDAKTANFINDRISSFMQDDLLPQFELILEKYDPGEEVVRFKELRIDLLFGDWRNPENLKIEICNRLEEKLRAKIPFAQKQNGQEFTEKTIRKISPQKNREQVFLFFLENGRLPWYANQEQIREISRKDFWKESLENEQFVEKLKKELETVNFSTRRFVVQFSKKMVFLFLQTQYKDFSKADIRKLNELTKQFSAANQKLFLQWLVELVISGNELKRKIHLHKLRQLILKEKMPSADEVFKTGVVQVLKKIHPDFSKDEDWSTIYESGKNKVVPEKTKDKSDIPVDAFEEDAENVLQKEDEIFVGNAGLILLHPFFKSFFNEFEFLDETGQILNHKKEPAVQALHYLATGSEDFFEGNLVFEKFLCNVPLKWPIARESQLNEKIKNEADSLLNAAIKHWPALKNTSADGLRQNYLQRNGKLINKEGNYRLLVERKTQDILLERISWNISVVKLPWMKNLLHVEW